MNQYSCKEEASLLQPKQIWRKYILYQSAKSE